MGYGAALVIGIAQVLALIPGTSRSGITMTAARALGLERDEAARFSMLLSIPTIIAAGALLGLDLIERGTSCGRRAARRLPRLRQRLALDRAADALARAGELHAVRDLPLRAGRWRLLGLRLGG